MADKPMRVLRAYSLPVDLFDHLNAIKRRRQADIDSRTGKVNQAGDSDWISTSEALSGVLYAHRLMTSIAERVGVTVEELISTMALNGVTIRPQANSDAVTVGIVEVSR